MSNAALEMTDAAPENITSTDTRPLTDVCFDHFALHPLLLQGLTDAGFVRLTPIQALTLPLTLEGKDIAGQAQTGTGKTLAFLVTILNRLLSQPAHAERRASDPRAVVLAPTRELAIQIEKDAVSILRQTGLRIALIYGGVDYDKQRELLKSGCDIVVATPGRLIDYVKQHVVNLGSVDIVVMDEADRMFDLGFIKDIRFLLRKMPPREQRQSLLFSATLSHRVLELAYEHMNEAQKITVETDSVTADRVRQVVYFPANEEKIPLLIGLLSRMDAHRTMIFVNTKVWVERVARALERAHFRVGVLSGDVPQPKREKLLAKFKKAELDILVATDVAARGLHIDSVSHVFNFDLPFDAEDYVHRIGRTARLGAEGDAISFACELYAMSLPDVEKYIGMSIPRANVEPELLQAIPRTPIARPEGADGEAVESIYSLLHDETANALRDKQRERSGRGPAPRGRPGERPGGRSGGGRNERSGGKPSSGPRRESGERPSRRAEPAAPVAAVPVAAPPAAVPATDADGVLKKRRRRGGRGRRRGAGEETGTAIAANGSDAQAAAPPPPAPVAETPGPFLARVRQRIKSLVNRLPLPGRRR